MEIRLPADYSPERDGTALFYFGDDPCFPCHPSGTDWNGFDNVRVSPAVREVIACDWRGSGEDETDEESSLAQLLAIQPDEQGLIDLGNCFATSLDFANLQAVLDAGFVHRSAIFAAVDSKVSDWRQFQAPDGADNETREQEEADTVVAVLGEIRAAFETPPESLPFLQRIRAAGFDPVETPRGLALRRDGKGGFAEFTNAKGTNLPSESDWALEVRQDGHEDEPHTDIQHDDEGADIGEAIATALAVLAEFEAA